MAWGDRYASDAHASGTRELLHVLQGAVVVDVAEQVVTLETGDAVSFLGDVPHAYANPGAASARFSLSVYEPDVGTPPRARATRAGSEPGSSVAGSVAGRRLGQP